MKKQIKEGLAISTDPETPWDIIMPEAPLMQLVADGEELETLTKSLLRGDNDYVILEEMRDAKASDWHWKYQELERGDAKPRFIREIFRTCPTKLQPR